MGTTTNLNWLAGFLPSTVVNGNTCRATCLDVAGGWQQFLNRPAGSQPVTTSMAKIILYLFVFEFLFDTCKTLPNNLVFVLGNRCLKGYSLRFL